MSRKLQRSNMQRKRSIGENGEKGGNVCECVWKVGRVRKPKKEKNGVGSECERKEKRGGQVKRKGVPPRHRGDKKSQEGKMSGVKKKKSRESQGRDLREKDASRRARTCDPQLRRLMLFRLSQQGYTSLRRERVSIIKGVWSNVEKATEVEYVEKKVYWRKWRKRGKCV